MLMYEQTVKIQNGNTCKEHKDDAHTELTAIVNGQAKLTRETTSKDQIEQNKYYESGSRACIVNVDLNSSP